MQRKKTTEQALLQFRRIRKKIYGRAGERTADASAGALMREASKARSRYRRISVSFALNRIGIRDAEVTKMICSVFGKKSNLLDGIIGDIKAGEKTKTATLQMRKEFTAEQLQAAQREAVKTILGKQKGEKFWAEFRKIREGN